MRTWVRTRRTKARRKRIYRALRELGFQQGKAHRMRDWTEKHIILQLVACIKHVVSSRDRNEDKDMEKEESK